jgi:superfamily II DNA or RNA helicase
MELKELSELESKMIRKLRQYSIKDIQKGFKLLDTMSADINSDDDDDDVNDLYYVDIVNYLDEQVLFSVKVVFSKDAIEDKCDCTSFHKTGSCKHITAAIIEIIFEETDLLMEEILELALKPDPGIDPGTSARVIPLFEEQSIPGPWHSFRCSPGKVFQHVYRISGHNRLNTEIFKKVTLLTEDKEIPSWSFEFESVVTTKYYPEIKYDKYETFTHRCTCPDRSVICIHVTSSFGWLQCTHDAKYFEGFKDWGKEKAIKLGEYGLQPGDEEAKHVQFFTDYYGGLQIKVPEWLWGKNAEAKIADFKKSLVAAKSAGLSSERPKLTKEAIIDFRIGFLFNFTSMHFKTGFELETIKVFDKGNSRSFKKLSIHNAANLGLLRELPDELYDLILRITDESIKEYLEKSGHGYVGNYPNAWNNVTTLMLGEVNKYYLAQLQKIWPYLCERSDIYELKEGSFGTKNIQPLKLSADPVSLGFSLQEDVRFITVQRQFLKDQKVIEAKNIQLHTPGILVIDGVLHLPANLDDLGIFKQFQEGFIKIPVASKLSVITNLIPSLQKKYHVNLSSSLQIKTIEVAPKPQVLLQEYNTQYLMLKPQFVYEDVTVNYESDPQDILQTLPDGSWQLLLRNHIKEKAFFDDLRSLHQLFPGQARNDFYFLPFEDVMKKNWFLHTIHQLQDNDIPVLGLQELKKFRYNTNKPVWDMKAGSGIDWFDLSIKISFGNQSVPLKDVRKAINNKQNIVLLGDGTIGVLPEEWLHQYGLLLKMGDEQKDGTLRLSKLHYTLIDELHDQIDDEKVIEEINNKKQKLLNIGNIKTVKISKQINASLRPYQQSGFQWMQTLDELGWGGCLADDMGLGKTLQAITFLQFIKEKYKGCTNLVICPTSLIYNWETELKKFAPTLSYHIYYGTAREFSHEHFEDYDIVITSYGIIRNDLQHLLQFQWHYVVLDESQTIKNPDAQTTKAVQLLKSKNRLILSGTPVQNNTYDLYSQFNFINPGLLGNREFFKDFANGIDKHNDAEKVAQLRRLVYPFMLRRTKEQVATDLPDKTEMVLWCEMSKEQRAVYDDFKNYYRTTLIKKIEEVGMAKASLYILEGLLRLRQICDSPELLKSDDVTTNKSIKIDELIREIAENSGQHKLLVFSQFTSMLELIRGRMDEVGINHVYLDGSTTAVNRKKNVDKFQTDPSIKVFLISLKAGGLGLNLTAADYVYMVDPWWNPAVEQQAIDRTHRIGQTRKIFSYKMICKNTIEEKIMELQQRKKQIASELVTEDTGFIKKLKKDDIEFLFN